METQPIFQSLKDILKSKESDLVVVQDKDDNYYLNTPTAHQRDKEMFFGAVQIKKNYVSFHLMPVYVNPDLLSGMSEDLKKRMQGKSCFNFKTSEPHLFEELKTLTDRGFEDYKKQGYLV